MSLRYSAMFSSCNGALASAVAAPPGRYARINNGHTKKEGGGRVTVGSASRIPAGGGLPLAQFTPEPTRCFTGPRAGHFRFSPNNGHHHTAPACLKRAKGRLIGLP